MKRCRPQPCLVIPIETKVRELHAKLYMAGVAAERGFRVILGGAKTLRNRICWLPRRAFFLDKSVAPSRAVWFRNYQNLGLRPVAWCEEGLTFCDENEYLRRKVHADSLARVEWFFAWGPYQANLIKTRHPARSSRILETGNPRIDLLSPSLRGVFDDDADQLRARYPRMILINTNFSLCNHKNGDGAFLADLKANGKIKTPEDERFALEWVAHKQLLFDAFREMIPALSAAFPRNTIVIRPHPSERHETWSELIRTLPNVVLVHEGNVIPWLMAAEAVLHNGCTTGLEGALLGRVVIAYQPVTSEKYDIELPNRVSLRVPDLAGVIRVLHENQSGKTLVDIERVYQQVQTHLSSLDGGATNRIADCLWAHRDERRKSGILSRVICLVRRGYWQFRFRLRPPAALTPHELQKFPGLTLEEVQALLHVFQQWTGRFRGIAVGRLGPDQFLLEKAPGPAEGGDRARNHE